jgi:hypothetical protein
MIELQVDKNPLYGFYTITAFPHHEQMKENLLKLISEQDAPCERNNNVYYNDAINKYDFNRCFDWDREWVKEFAPVAKSVTDTICESLGYQYCSLVSMWFQQYVSGDTHGWHVHDSNFSCVYFLELPDNTRATELINPFCQSNRILPEVKEGDILMFPSFVLHRSPMIKQGRKTSIAFNINVELVRQDIIDDLRKYND